MTSYEQGFLTKCAEYGVDGRALLEKLAGPRPEERRQIQSITSNPATLRALTTPEAAPPRIDDPVWNPANVQKWVTGASTAPVLPMATRALAALPANAAADTLAGGAIYGTLASAPNFLHNWVPKFFERRQLSADQRKRDASAILSGQKPGKALWARKP